MKINCISCGHSIELGNNYDDYKGPVKCWVCSKMLSVAAESGQVKSVVPLQRVSGQQFQENESAPHHPTQNIVQ